MKYMYTTVGALSGSCIYFMIFEFHKFQNDLYPISSRRITFSSTELVDSVKENIKWLGFDWGEHEYYASDCFDQMYAWAKENGYLIPGDWREWVSKDYEQITLLNYPQLSKEEIDEFIDKGLKEFYFRPNQIARMLLKIRTVSDFRRKLFGFRKFVKYLQG